MKTIKGHIGSLTIVGTVLRVGLYVTRSPYMAPIGHVDIPIGPDEDPEAICGLGESFTLTLADTRRDDPLRLAVARRDVRPWVGLRRRRLPRVARTQLPTEERPMARSEQSDTEHVVA